MNNIVGTVRCSNFLDFSWPSSTEHQSLSFYVLDKADDLLNVFFETHIKHFIGLVKTQESAPHQIGFFAI